VAIQQYRQGKIGNVTDRQNTTGGGTALLIYIFQFSYFSFDNNS
jgi:hypothetical protein